MEFTSETGLVEVAVSLLAAVSALIGVSSSLSQLSRSAKARRTIEWIDKLTSENAENCNSSSWKAIKTSEEAYLIASYHVGRWQSAMTLAWLAVSPLFILVIIYFKNILILVYCVAGMFALSRQEIKADYKRRQIIKHYKANEELSLNVDESKCCPIVFALIRSLGALLLYGSISLAALYAKFLLWNVISLVIALVGGYLLFSSMRPSVKEWWIRSRKIIPEGKVKSMSVALPEPEYLQRIGEVAYAASSLEWTLLGDLNRLSDRLPGDFSLDALEQKTMGRISSMTKQAAEQCADPEVRYYLETTARALDVVKGVRNDVLHARPATMSPGEKQRLYRLGANGRRFWVDDEWLDRKMEEVDQAIKDVNAARPPFTG